MAQTVCSEKEWNLIDLKPDEGMSGYKGVNRIKGTLGLFLKKVDKGEIQRGSVLIIEKMDRFSRNEVDLVLNDFLTLLQSEIEIYSCVDSTHYTLADIRKNPMLLNYAVMAMAMASDFSKSLGKRIKTSIDIRLDKCRNDSTLRYSLGGWTPRWLTFIGEKKQNGKYVFNEHAATVKRIVKEYLDGKSKLAIAKIMSQENIPAFNCGKWGQQTIFNLLNNPTLIGDITINGIFMKSYFPAVIPLTEYNRLQAKLSENKIRRGGNTVNNDKIANLFRNRCRCFHCGYSIQAKKVSNTNHSIFTCIRKNIGDCDSRKSIRVEYIEQDFFLNYLQKHPEELLSQNTTDHTDKVSAIQTEIAMCDNDIKMLIELMAAVPIDDLKRKLVSVETKRQMLKNDLDKLNISTITSHNVPKALDDIRALFSNEELNTLQTKVDKRINDFLRDGGILKEVPFEENIVDTLKNHIVRKQLLTLLPSIIKHLVIDTTNKRYAVVSHNGIQSEWQDVRGYGH